MAHLKSQSGSVVSFVLVAIVLVGLTIGGVWFARNRGSVSESAPLQIAKSDKESKDSQTRDSNNKDQQTADKRRKAEADAKKKIEADKKIQDDAKSSDKPDEAPKQESKDVPVADKPEATPGAKDTNSSTPMQRDATENGGAAELPPTGPAQDLLASIVGLTAIAGASYVYYHFGRK